jgi:phosphoribosylamine--glycine ligase
VFCAGVGGAPGGLRTAGGRVATVVGRAPLMRDAIADAYRAAERIRFPGMQLRTDIGRSGVPVSAGAVA